MDFSIEIIAALICLLITLTVYFVPGAPLYLKLFPIYIAYAIVTQEYLFYLASHSRTNTLFYNLFSLAEVVYYLFIFHEVIRNRNVKNILVYIAPAYFIAGILNIIFQKVAGFNVIIYCLGVFLVVSFCIFYFYELFQLPQTKKLSQDPAFWLCTAFLFNYCCTFPLNAFVSFLRNPPRFLVIDLDIIRMIVNIFTYSLFSIAFLCRFKTNKSILSS
ncbi:MAG: hypothetical protein C5B59_20895 [Bacteroidetes bacterium]|nr:MAG: hypothetical protein C5B59_20895 [Bacteroidota bacterium]